MPTPLPAHDGDVRTYTGGRVTATVPVIIYVNGIQTTPEGHRDAAVMVSDITERPVVGVYNATGGVGGLGMAADLAQCLMDWTSGFGHKATEYLGRVVSAPVNEFRELVHRMRQRHGARLPEPTAVNLLMDANRLLPEVVRIRLIDARLALYNRATRSLYHQLVARRDRPVFIVAHSQGNLITADALWAVVATFGQGALATVRVYSLASPSPGWPMGLRHKRKVYGHVNDPVTRFDPHNWPIFARTPFRRTAGDWRTYRGPGNAPGVPLGERLIAPHDLTRNAHLTNFAPGIRRDLGLPPRPGPAGVE